MKTIERLTYDARFAALWSIDAERIIDPKSRHAASIKDVSVGGVIKIANAVYLVEKTARYFETDQKYKEKLGWSSTELVLRSLMTGATHYLEWEEDDEIIISYVDRKLTTRELNQRLLDDEGEHFDLDEDLDEVVEQEWGIKFDGQLYDYDDDYPVVFESSDGRKGRAYFYEFVSEVDGYLTIEAWKDGSEWEYEGFVSSTINPKNVEIISLGR